MTTMATPLKMRNGKEKITMRIIHAHVLVFQNITHVVKSAGCMYIYSLELKSAY